MDFTHIGGGKAMTCSIDGHQLPQGAELFLGFDPVHFPLALDPKQVLEYPTTGAGLKLRFYQACGIVFPLILHRNEVPFLSAD
jgi:hypothetical protein